MNMILLYMMESERERERESESGTLEGWTEGRKEGKKEGRRTRLTNHYTPSGSSWHRVFWAHCSSNNPRSIPIVRTISARNISTVRASSARNISKE